MNTTAIDFDSHVETPVVITPPPPPAAVTSISATTSRLALGTASILLGGRIGRPQGHAQMTVMPRDIGHAKEAALWAGELLEMCGNDPVKAECAARIMVGYQDNPQSQHCSKEELFAYAIEGTKRLYSMTRAPTGS